MFRAAIFPTIIILSVLSATWLVELSFPELGSGYDNLLASDHFRHVSLSTASMFVAALTPFPAEVVAISNSMSYGPVAGFALTWISALSGASLAFFTARILGRKTIIKLIGKRYGLSLDDWMVRHGLTVFIVARFIPFVPFFLLNYGAGMTNMRFGFYIAWTGIGITPMILLCVIFGNRLHQADWQSAMIILSVFSIIIGTGAFLHQKYKRTAKKDLAI